MPISKSGKKTLRQELKRRVYNNSKKQAIKDLKKKILALVKEEKRKEANNLLPEYYKAVDKASKVGIIKKNTAARKKSRMTKFTQEKK
ncbi:MAG: 30S ribosomal protein S20 [Patescibacteria group bacterium]|nr:30S ribosomal protein S20 [Patescibacteria group bacterium]